MPALFPHLNSGVYVIFCIGSGRIYVGSANNFAGRWRGHRNQLRKGAHENNLLQGAWNKYGEASFKFFIVDRCPKEDCVQLEQKYIDAWKPFYPIGYNICEIAGSMLGFSMTTEVRKKIGDKSRNRSKETRAKLRAAKLGTKATEESKSKISEKLKQVYKSGERKPTVFTADVREKMADAKRGKKHTVEHNEKMSKLRKGKPKSPEHKAKIAAALRSEESRKKQSEAAKLIWSERKSNTVSAPLDDTHADTMPVSAFD